MGWLFFRIVGPLLRWWHHGRKAAVFYCPWCGDFIGDVLGDKPWFRLECSGVQPGTVDGPAVHWMEGVQTCPRCRYSFDYADSN